MREEFAQILEDMQDRFEATLPKEMRQAQYKNMQRWKAEDGWIIGYTTTRVVNSKHDGKFLVVAYQPYGKGSRGGKKTAQHWKLVYQRSFAQRKTAKARAITLFRKHSPKWDAKYGGRF